jgi:hypothetical protein
MIDHMVSIRYRLSVGLDRAPDMVSIYNYNWNLIAPSIPNIEVLSTLEVDMETLFKKFSKAVSLNASF